MDRIPAGSADVMVAGMIARLKIIWWRHCLRCLEEERIQYTQDGMWAGPVYLQNSAAMARDLRGRISKLECGL